MRYAILVIPTLFLLACSSGGDGKPVNLPNGAFGVEGSGIPVFPGESAPSGSTNGGPRDTGTVEGQTDTGHGGTDTGTAAVDTGTGGGGDEALCSSKCPADPTPSTSTCIGQLNGTKCPSEYRAAYGCIAERRVCDSSDKTDQAATSEACNSELMVLQTCLMGA